MNCFHVFNKRQSIGVAVMALLGPGVSLPAQESAPHAATLWQNISYPELTFSKSQHDSFIVSVGYGQQYEKATFRVDVVWGTADWSKITPDDIKKVTQITLHLHYPDGNVVEPIERPDRLGGGAGNGKSMQFDQMYRFPYGPNKLVEARVELRLPDRAYWLEIPYGFTRDPCAPLPPAEPDAGRPALAPAMQHLAPDDRIVHWTKVDYDLGPIQNGWRLSLALANAFDAKAEAILYRDDSQVGKSMFLWQLDTPKTSMEIRLPGGGVLASQATGKRLHEDGMRRSDGYAFNRDPAQGRGWGTLVIKVDDHVSECVLPSSLYEYTHGRVDYPDAKLVLSTRANAP